MNEQAPQRWDKFYLKDVSFKNLMTHRIFNVLIIANPYDAFMLEDDGRVDDVCDACLNATKLQQSAYNTH